MIVFAFVPGFILLSCFRHWFAEGERFKLKDLEMIFWSIPLSLVINVLSIGILQEIITKELGNMVVNESFILQIQIFSILIGSAFIFFFLEFLYFSKKYNRESEKIIDWFKKYQESKYVVEYPPEIAILSALTILQLLFGGIFISVPYTSDILTSILMNKIGWAMFFCGLLKIGVIIQKSYHDLKKAIKYFLLSYASLYYSVKKYFSNTDKQQHKKVKKNKKIRKYRRIREGINGITTIYTLKDIAEKYLPYILTFLLGAGTIYVATEYTTASNESFLCTQNETQELSWANQCQNLEIGQSKPVTEDIVTCVCTGNVCGEFFITKQSDGHCIGDVHYSPQ